MSENFYPRKSQLKSKHIYLFIIILIIKIKSTSFNIQGVSEYNKSYLNTSCFNDKIEMPENFRAGHFETFKDGSLIIEYSEDNSNSNQYEKRLFYGLKKNGRYYFPDESPFKHFEFYNTSNNKYTGRFEPKNKIIYLSGEINKEKEYLFSTGSYLSVTELHDVEGNISYYWDTGSFWEIAYIFSYDIIILNLPENNENHYICVIKPAKTIQTPASEAFSIKKFKFDSFDNYSIINKVNYTESFNCRTISAFIVYDCQIIVIFFLKKDSNNYVKYSLAFYNYDLIKKIEISIDFRLRKSYIGQGWGVFFRCFLIKERLAAFFYFLDKDYSSGNIIFQIGELSNNSENPSFQHRLYYIFSNEYEYAPSIYFNDFLKVEDKRLAFITSYVTQKNLVIFLIDLYNDYNNYIIRRYLFDDFNEGYIKDFQGYIYNGYLLLTYSFHESDTHDLFSTLLFFGYANGTDYELDISLYLMDLANYNSENNLYNTLISSCIIDNNIFGYELVPNIFFK